MHSAAAAAQEDRLINCALNTSPDDVGINGGDCYSPSEWDCHTVRYETPSAFGKCIQRMLLQEIMKNENV